VLPNKEQPTIDHTDLMDWLYIHYARQHLKLGSNRMKTHYDRLANFAGYKEGGQV
jgi:hypothetical protein